GIWIFIPLTRLQSPYLFRVFPGKEEKSPIHSHLFASSSRASRPQKAQDYNIIPETAKTLGLYNTCAQYPRKPEEDIRTPGLALQTVLFHHLSTEN
ncbi:mCG144642, partial [Mus musculus]